MAHAHVERLHHGVSESLQTSSAHLELIADMKRLNSLFCSTAHAALEAAALDTRRSAEARADDRALGHPLPGRAHPTG
ncbi:MAG TPA: hypothetical protein DCX26_05530 [Pseudomonas sp.]|nr:hypothetical protein [Pseudomonas sp.]